MSNSMALFIALGLTGQRAVSDGLRRTGRDGSDAARQMGSSWRTAGRQISDVGRIARDTAAMVGGTALLRSVITDVAEFERGLTEMRLTGELTGVQMGKIRREMLAMARPDLQLPEDQLAAFQKMVAAGIDPRVAMKGLHDLNRSATATFSDLSDISQTSIDLLQKLEISPEKWGRAFDILAKGGKLGKFELKDMARYIPVVASDMQRFGIVGERGIAQMTAMLQIARRGTALPSEAATNMQNFFGHITQYSKDFRKLGINVWEFFDLKTGKVKAGKDIDDFFKEIIRKSKGSVAMLEMAGIRDIQAKAFIQGMMQNWKEYERMRDESFSAKGTIARDFDVAKNTTWGKLKEAQIAKSEAMKSDQASSFAGAAADMLKMAVDNPLASLGVAAGAFGLYKFGKNALSKRPGGGGIPGAGGFSGSGAPLPVYVVNKHLSMLPGEWGFPGGAPGMPPVPGGKAGGWNMAGKAAGLAAGGLVVSVAAAPIVSKLISDAARENGWGSQTHRRGSKEYDVMGVGKRDINLTVQIDSQGRVTSRSDDMASHISTVKRGAFFEDMMKGH